MEKNCKWHFKEEGGRDVGPNDPVDEKFKGQPYYSIVRESIQNSLDAVKDENNPVIVVFNFFELTRKDFPNFFQIENNIYQCEKYFQKNDNAKRLFNDMHHYLKGNQSNKIKNSLTCLKISDFNTRGMSYNLSDTTSPFYAFLRAGGVSAKGHGSGGSFGFGKGAYYTLSPIKTIVVSTRDEKNNTFFEGSTILTTHIDDTGKKLTAYGYYDNNNGEPTNVDNDIPEIFKREKIGTDVNIIGLWDEQDRINLMIKSVLNNFWLAIFDNRLVIQIHNTIINKENLEQNIDEYFPNEYESGNSTEIESWNPKAYFKAIKYSGVNDQFKTFEEDLEILGKIKFHVYLAKGLPNRTSYFRKPKMVVFKRTSRKINGYAAVFVCENDLGNEILRLMENPAHNEWKKENYPKNEGKIDKIARKAENELSTFINKILDSLTKLDTSKKVAFLGLEDYLSIPDDLLEKDESSDLSGENTNSISGDASNNITDNETGLQTTEKNDPIIKVKIKSKSEVKEEENAEPDEDGNLVITTGSENCGGGIGPIYPPGPEGKLKKGDLTDGPNKSKVLVGIRLKVAAQIFNDVVFHNLLITSDKEITNSELELYVGGDNDKEDGLEISSTDTGKFEGNKLKEVHLLKGINHIKVSFTDNLKHSIKAKTYEVQ